MRVRVKQSAVLNTSSCYIMPTQREKVLERLEYPLQSLVIFLHKSDSLWRWSSSLLSLSTQNICGVCVWLSGCECLSGRTSWDCVRLCNQESHSPTLTWRARSVLRVRLVLGIARASVHFVHLIEFFWQILWRHRHPIQCDTDQTASTHTHN